MNRKQKICLLAGITAIVVMGLYPPWVLERKVGVNKYVIEPGPYSWINDPPVRAAETKTVYHPAYHPVREPDDSEYVWQMRKLGATKERYETITTRLEATAKFVDLYRLGVQYFIVAVVTAGLIITLRDRKTG